MGKILYLPIEKKWFDMIVSGEKKEEYREISYHWHPRLVDRGLTLMLLWEIELTKNPISFKEFDYIIFSNGYRKDRPQIKVECKGISVAEGREEWGAEKGKKYFVLALGKITK